MMTLIREVAKEHVIQYVLVMLDDLLVIDKIRVKMIHATAAKQDFNVWPPLRNLLNRDDPIIMHVASRLLAKLATFSKTRMPDSDLVYYLSWLKGQLSLPVSDVIVFLFLVKFNVFIQITPDRILNFFDTSVIKINKMDLSL